MALFTHGPLRQEKQAMVLGQIQIVRFLKIQSASAQTVIWLTTSKIAGKYLK
jgi:hypothetical protein